MTSTTFRFIATLVAWGSIYPLTLMAIFLFDANARQEFLWQLKFESHYLLIRQLIVDGLAALMITFVWLAVILLYWFMRKTAYAKTAVWVFISYPIILVVILKIAQKPDIFWQMAITGALLNLLFVGKKK